ncbi:MAG: sulfatase-like hydrolase/transferase [Planctomycetota bacterium]|jgi:arylsulfatase A-like enzyme
MSGPARGGRPNVLFFFTDDQRFDTIRALGNPEIVTPNIDRLVERGVAFRNAYIMGGTCGAVCMPSRAMLHSGRTLWHIEREGQGIPEEHTTLGETLRAAGYDCFGTGKWHNGPQSYARSFSAGAEVFLGGMGDHWNVPAFDFDPEGKYDSRLPFCKDPGLSRELGHRKGDHVHAGRHSTDVFCDATANFLRGLEGDRSFFTYLSFMAPHDPRTMPGAFLEMYDPAKLSLPPNYAPVHPFDNGEMSVRDERLEAWPRTEEAVLRHKAEYYAMISHLDAGIGRVLDALEETGRAEDTIIVFAGDNGLAVGRHGLMGKQSLYEHSIHVPLLMSGPGIPRGEEREGLAYLLDIFPTLCDLVGIETPASVEGRSLAPVLSDPGATVRERLSFAYRHLHRAATDGRWKLIEYLVEGRRRTQLFDLAADPWETNDLSTDPARAGEVEALRAWLLARCGDLDDPDGAKVLGA